MSRNFGLSIKFEGRMMDLADCNPTKKVYRNIGSSSMRSLYYS